MTSPRKRSGARGAARSRNRPGRRRLAPVPEPSRAGEDVRRRGWFWHWNALVTQYAPLIGLQGGRAAQLLHGLDRPPGGVAPPRLRLPLPAERGRLLRRGPRRADHDQQDPGRARPDRDPQGDGAPRRSPGPALEGAAQLLPGEGPRRRLHPRHAATCCASPSWPPATAPSTATCGASSRPASPRSTATTSGAASCRRCACTPVWQGLAARAAAEEDRASARTRAGHAARKGAAAETERLSRIPLPRRHFLRPMPVTARQSRHGGNDSGSVTSQTGERNLCCIDQHWFGGRCWRDQQRFAAKPAKQRCSHQRSRANRCCTEQHDVSPIFDNNERRNRRERRRTARSRERTACQPVAKMTTTRAGRSGGPGTRPPADGPGEAAALRAFESANDRAATPAERKLLRDLAARFEPVAAAAHQERDDVPGSGWGWLEAAVWDAVEAGSAFVAPRRVREILLRWERDGFPQPRDPGPPRPEPPRGRSHPPRARETTSLRRGRCRRSLPSRRSGSPTGRSGRRPWPSWRGGATSAGPIWRPGCGRPRSSGGTAKP